MATGPKYKKAPDAPKRFKSAFIIFSAEKHKEIKDNFAKEGRSEKTTDIAKLVSEAWREMSAQEKEVWDKRAQKDKARYEVEKAMYKGPWKIPANKRTPKDPAAPKRPMSAFLAFSNKRRAALKREHPDATNADLSKMLSISWKEAPEDLRSKYMEEESGLRTTYKNEMGKWRKKVAEEKKVERQEREAIAMEAAESGHVPEPSPPAPAPAPEPRRYGKSSTSSSAASTHAVSHHPDEPPPGYHHHHHHQPPPPAADQSGAPIGPGVPPGPGGIYGNPYGAEYGYSGIPPNPGPGGYPPMMGGQPYGSQHYMGGHSQQPYMPPPYMNHQYKPSSHGGQRGMYGQSGPPPPLPAGQHGYGGYAMGEMSPHQHPSHLSGHGGYRPEIGHGGMHEMMGHHRDPYGHNGKKEEHHYNL